MSCISPQNIPRPNGTGSSDRITVPCNKCYECLQAKRADWSFRLAQELKCSKTAFFLTLTYSEEKTCLNKDDIQKWLKKLRKALHGQKIRYYVTGEYGTQTKRPHYHAIMFNLPQDSQDLVTKTWGLGFTMIGTVTPASIHYVTKYSINKHEAPKELEKPFAMMSTKPAIGSNYLKTSGKYHHRTKKHYATLEDGIKQRLPRFYKDKIFSKMEKEINQLNTLSAYDKLKTEVEERLRSKGENVGQYLINQIEQKRDKLNKSNKKSSL